jgi:hypothetical protein
MTMVQEALRMFLAISALILTAMLSSPAQDAGFLPVKAKPSMAQMKKPARRVASQDTKKIRVAANEPLRRPYLP